MANYQHIADFKIDITNFKLFKNSKGEFKTVSRTDGGKDQEYFYEDFELLYAVFEDDFTREELAELCALT